MNGNSLTEKVGSVFGVLVGFAVILYLAYLATKILGKRMTIGGRGNKNIKILESVPLGQNKSLMIVEAAGKTFLLGITSNEISLVSELDGENLVADSSDKNAETMEFSSALKKVLENNFGRKFSKSKEKSNDHNGKE